jgi:hypothetical protein
MSRCCKAGRGIPEGERVNDATLAEWIRQRKRAGMFAGGKLLYEQGGLRLDRLGEEAEVEVDEDCQTCVRALPRARALTSPASRARA